MWGLFPLGEGEDSWPCSSSPGPLAWVLMGGLILHFTEEDAKTQKDCRLYVPQIHICQLQLNINSGSWQPGRLPGLNGLEELNQLYPTPGQFPGHTLSSQLLLSL